MLAGRSNLTQVAAEQRHELASDAQVAAGRYDGPVDGERSILHVDMDAFFASVEQRDDPALRGKPVLVGGAGKRGVVATASYEARAFGCRSAQPMATALKLCPDAIVVPSRGHAYREASDAIHEVFREATPLIQPLSIDEAFLDITGTERLHGAAVDVAQTIKDKIHERTSLTASVGVAPNMFLAKLASDLRKPDGLVVITRDNVQSILDPLSIRRIPGIGPKSEPRFTAHRIETIGDLRARSREELTRIFGSHAKRLYDIARGIDHRRLTPDGEAKSISQECTFAENVPDPDYVRSVLRGHTQDVARRLRRHGLRAKTVSLKIRYGQFQTITRSRSFREATYATEDLLDAACALWATWVASGFQPVRLIGVGTSNFTTKEPEQTLFPDRVAERRSRLDETLDALHVRFGRGTVTRADTKTSDRADGLGRGDDAVRREDRDA